MEELDKVHFEPMSEPSEGPIFHAVEDHDGWTVMRYPGTDGPAHGWFNTIYEAENIAKDMGIAYAQGCQSMQTEVEALKAELKTNVGRLKTMTDIASILATEIGLCPNKEAHPSEGVLTKHFPAKKERP